MTQDNQQEIKHILQLAALNSLRGIAAILILTHHITVYTFPEIAVFTQKLTPFWKNNYLWVDFFFILSGFIACHVHQSKFGNTITRSNYISFIVSRFIRLYPLHLAVLICFLMMELVYLFLYNHVPLSITYENLRLPFDGEYSEKALLLNVFFLQSLPQWGSWNGPAWAVSAIWIIAFTIPFLIKYVNKFNWVVNIVVSLFSLLSIVTIYRYNGTLDIQSWSGLVRCFSETLLGIIAYNAFIHTSRNCILDSSTCCISLFLLTMISIAMPIHPVITIIIFIPLIISAAHIKSNIFLTNRTLIFLGKTSFSLYMAHWFVLQLIDNISIWTTGEALHNHYSLLLLFLFSGLLLLCIPALSYIIHSYIESPLHNFLKRILSRN